MIRRFENWFLLFTISFISSEGARGSSDKYSNRHILKLANLVCK